MTSAPASASRWDSPPLSVVGALLGLHGEPDLGQRGGDPRRHLASGHLDVLQAEGDVTPDGRGDHSGSRVLEDEADRAGLVLWGPAIDRHRRRTGRRRRR